MHNAFLVVYCDFFNFCSSTIMINGSYWSGSEVETTSRLTFYCNVAVIMIVHPILVPWRNGKERLTELFPTTARLGNYVDTLTLFFLIQANIAKKENIKIHGF